MADATDEELVARCRDGGEDAFAELVTRYRGMVFGLIARTVGDRERAEDLAQEVFLRVHRGLPYFRGTSRLSTWIYRIVINVCLQARHVPRTVTVAFDGDPPREMVAPERSDSSLELRDRLEKALARLPVPQRLLVAAHYLKDVRYEELAEAFGMPLGTVKTHLYRAKRELRRLLETEFR
jgi:RNA polymerase sigma-70 factor (ECF subfamily)